MYSFESRIRYSECDSGGRLTLASLLNYFQDCSIFHSEDLGLGLEYLKHNQLVWVLSSWQIVVNRYPRLCEKVETGTFPYDFRGFLGSRNFFMKTEDGMFAAKASTLWSLLSTETMKPAALPEEMLAGYVLEDRLSMDYAPRKIRVPSDGQTGEPISVKKYHLDTNHHVNNGQFVTMAMEYLPGEFEIAELRAEYKKQAWLDDVLIPFIAVEGNRYIVSLRDERSLPYVNVEFRTGKEHDKIR